MVREFYEKFNYSEQMSLIYGALFDTWVEIGGNMFNIFVECYSPTIHGYWGAKRSLGDDQIQNGWKLLLSIIQILRGGKIDQEELSDNIVLDI